MLISLAIPVYNAELYIEECLLSILKQQNAKYEIIIVDDGSNDNSYKICKEYANQYPNKILLYSRPNKGSLATRVECINYCNGDYIYIIDADDYLLGVDVLENINRIIIENGADLIIFNATSNVVNKKKLYDVNVNENILYEKDKELIYNEFFNSYILNPLWNKVFKKKIFYDDSKETKNILSNGTDMFQSMQLIFNAQSIYLSSDIYYFYRYNRKSIVHKFNRNSYLSIKINSLRLKCFFESSGYSNVYNNQLYFREIRGICSAIIKIKYLKFSEIKIAIPYLEYIANDDFFLERVNDSKLSLIDYYRKKICELVRNRKYKLLFFLLKITKIFIS